MPDQAVNFTSSRGVLTEIKRQLTEGASSWVNRLAARIGSNQDSETYAWLGMSPAMREWIGERQPKNLREFAYTITNKDYEATIEIDTRDLRRDGGGLIQMRINDLARRVLAHPAKLLSTLMINGESTTCYDGQYFYDTDHDESGSNQSNDISVDISALAVTNHGSTTAPSVGEMRECIMQGVQQILGFKDDQGEPINDDATMFEVHVPTSLWAVAQAAVALPMVDSGEANIIPNLNEVRIVVVVNPRLTWTDRFSVFRSGTSVPAFILQEEQPLNVSAIAEGSELEFKNRKHQYGVDWAGNVGYGFWASACLVTMA